MRREARLNLWFLIVFLVLSLPGAVILFHKKLDPSASRMDQPDAVLNQLPYMAPIPAPPGIRWMVPPMTRAWLAELTLQKAHSAMLSSVPPGPEWEPVISADHHVQVMASSARGDTTTLDLLLWHGDWPGEAENYQLAAKADGKTIPGTVKALEPIVIPPEVRKELVSLGYIHPPKQGFWLAATLGQPLIPGERVTLVLSNVAPPQHRTPASWVVQ